MKQNLKILIVALVAIIGGLSGFSATTVKKAMPKVSEGQKLISLPNRFYYFDEQELHCYNTKTGEDTLIVKDIQDEIGASAYRVDKWYDHGSDCVYLNLDLGGHNQLYQITPGHKLNLMVELESGEKDHEVVEAFIDVTDDSVYLNGIVSSWAEVKIPGVDKGSILKASYTLGLKPWKFTGKSLESLKKPNVDFYEITAPGVNVRSYGDSKAPRLGYFETRPDIEDELFDLMRENEDINTNIYTRKFGPWHPEVGKVFASSKDAYTNEGWTNIIVGGLDYEPVVSSKFVKQVKTEPLVSMQQISKDYNGSSIWKMNSVKYPGVWFMLYDLPYDGDCLYIGKEIDGMIVFKWRAGYGILGSGEAGRFNVDNDIAYYGNDIYNNEGRLDLSKLNDNDFETLFKALEPVFDIPVVVKIADVGVDEFWINYKSFVTDPTKSAPQYDLEPAQVSTSIEEEIFISVDQQPEYPGGMPALMSWIGSNIRYPETAQINKVQGRVIVKFVVEKDGSITQPKIVKGVDEDLDNEALRVISNMPKWIPGKNNGVPVRSYYTLPVSFRLQSK